MNTIPMDYERDEDGLAHPHFNCVISEMMQKKHLYKLGHNRELIERIEKLWFRIVQIVREQPNYARAKNPMAFDYVGFVEKHDIDALAEYAVLHPREFSAWATKTEEKVILPFLEYRAKKGIEMMHRDQVCMPSQLPDSLALLPPGTETAQ